MPSEHGTSCFCLACTSATERIESDEALVEEFDRLAVSSSIDQRATMIVMILRSGDGYTRGRGVFVFSVASVRDCSMVQLTYRVKPLVV